MSSDTYELQLRDYEEGYRFRLACKGCGYGWYLEPKDVLAQDCMHTNMYLEEVAAALNCRHCRANHIEITPLLIKPQHHFVGGMV